MPRLVFLGKLGPLAPAALAAAHPPASVRTLDQLRDWVNAQAPALAAAGPVKLIVNHAIAHDLSADFGPGDEIAFIPPMSGG
jgi:molybdopterin converting factor small subunit